MPNSQGLCMKDLESLLGPRGLGSQGRDSGGPSGSEAGRGVPPYAPQAALHQARGLRLRPPALSMVLAEKSPQDREGELGMVCSPDWPHSQGTSP